MLKIITRISVVLLVAFSVGMGVFYFVNRAIDNAFPNSLLKGWSELFRRLRGFSSLGLAGIIYHALFFALIVAVIVSIDKLFNKS